MKDNSVIGLPSPVRVLLQLLCLLVRAVLATAPASPASSPHKPLVQ